MMKAFRYASIALREEGLLPYLVAAPEGVLEQVNDGEGGAWKIILQIAPCRIKDELKVYTFV